MDPAEEIVNAYLQSDGYFTITSTRVGQKELDILGIHPLRNHGLHAEVHVSLSPAGRLRPWGPLKFGELPLTWRVKALCNNKFIGTSSKETGEPINY